MNLLKRIGKDLLSKILEYQVKKLRKKHNFILIAVVGSVGKTSTKLAISRVLSSARNTRFQTGNYNDRLTVPLVIFGHENPGIFNLIKWIKILVSNQKQIAQKFKPEVVVVELGTDGPGQIKEFQYLKPDIAVVTAVKLEHMEFFNSLDDVAKEEMSVVKFSKKVFVNSDDVDTKYLPDLEKVTTYGLDHAEILARTTPSEDGQIIETMTKTGILSAEIKLLGKQGAKVALVAVAVSDFLGIEQDVIEEEIEKLIAFQGRMKLLKGVKSSKIIDDTYNASPVAVKAGLDVVYSMDAPQKIAILGNMNELGAHSIELHKEVGNYCDPRQLDWVVTIGPDANEYIASVAKKKGCKVMSFNSPYDAGEFVKSELKKNALVFAKGSQNGVFAEEAVKQLLRDQDGWSDLVRQSGYWLKVKKQQFGRN